jgi:hypothetical protein
VKVLYFGDNSRRIRMGMGSGSLYVHCTLFLSKVVESTTICIGGISLKGSARLLIGLERNEN